MKNDPYHKRKNKTPIYSYMRYILRDVMKIEGRQDVCVCVFTVSRCILQNKKDTKRLMEKINFPLQFSEVKGIFSSN
jgi:hypothetical protein